MKAYFSVFKFNIIPNIRGQARDLISKEFSTFEHSTLVWIAEKTLVAKNQNKVFKLRL